MKSTAFLRAWCLVVACAVCAPPAASGAPQWARVYAGDEGRWLSMARGTADGGHLAVGTAGEDALWLVRLSGTGNVLWEKTYPIRGRGIAAEEVPGGDFLVACSSLSADDFLDDVSVARIGPSGEVRWHRAYRRPGSDTPLSIERAGDGSYLVAATTASSADNGYQPWVLKIDDGGEVVWQRRYGAEVAGSWSIATSLEATPDGGCILAADENRLLKLDAGGEPQWGMRYPHVGFGQSRIESVKPAPGGGYVAAGYKPPAGESNMHVWVLRLDELGNVLWQRGYRFGEVASWAGEVVPAADGDFLVAGTYHAAWGDDDPFLMRLDPQGALRWARAYRRGGIQELAALAPAGGGFVAAGSTYPEPAADGFLLRVGADGRIAGCPLVSDVPVAAVAAGALATGMDEPWTATDAGPQAVAGAGTAARTKVSIGCADRQRLTVMGPNGGESVASGGVRTLRWRAPAGAVDFDLSLSTDRGRTWRLIAPRVPGASYAWQVPTFDDNRRGCFVRVAAFDAGGRRVDVDRSDAVFQLKVVELTQPSGTIEGGTAFTVRWRTFATVAPPRRTVLSFSRDGGASWRALADLEGDPGSWVWQVPAEHTREGLIRVRLEDRAGESVGHDENDRFFSIVVKP